MWTAEILAETLSTLEVENLPNGALQRAKLCLVDVLGAAAAGYDSAPASALRGMVDASFATGTSSIWFSGHSSQPTGAALANSAAASALDLDDGHARAVGHPGACAVAAAMAIAEETGATGSEVLGAIVVGYEVGVRIAAARLPARVDSVATGRWCAYGAAAAGGWLRRMPARTIAHALAIAGLHAPSLPPPGAGHVSTTGHTVKEGIPWATLTGLAALDLAGRGFTGRTALLDDERYLESGKIIEGFGEAYVIEEGYFKPYGCCRWIHSALDAFLEIREAHLLDPSDIEKISVDTFGMALTLSNHPNPASLEAAQFSIPFCLAVAAYEGRARLLPLRSELLGRSDLIALAAKIELNRDDSMDGLFPARRPARVIVEARGNRYERRVDHPLGDPENPMSPSQLEHKFRVLTQNRWSRDRQDEVIAAVESIDTTGWPSLVRLIRTAGRRGSGES